MSAFDRNKTIRRVKLEQMISGLKKQLPNQTLTLAGRAVTTEDFAQEIQELVDASDATEISRAQWRGRVATEKRLFAERAGDLRALRSYLAAIHGDSPSASVALGEFGLEPRKPGRKTMATLVAAAAKSRATRKARHTMGSRQKRAVTGVVEVPNVAALGASSANPAAPPATPVNPIAPPAPSANPTAAPTVPATIPRPPQT
jgi:hypothetical protein